ncbi:MAG TPA: glycosyltransferase [Gaiellaceae bacterium]
MLRALLTWKRREPQAEVLMVTSSWPRPDNPAYGIFVKRQLDSLAAAGLPFDVLVVNGFRSPLAYPLAALTLARLSLTREARYRLVHAHGGEAGVSAWFYRRAPLFVSYLGDDLLGTRREDGRLTRSSIVRSALLRQHARLARGSNTKSTEMANTLPRSVRSTNMVSPDGVDPHEFSPVPRDRARRQLGWPPNERVVLFASDPGVPVKRYWLAQHASEQARRQAPHLRLQVAAGIAAAEMPLLMSAADCLILTSAAEGSPNVVKEALMCNLPVVATRVGDVEELLEGVEPSVVCDADPSVLAAALLHCLEPPRRSNGRARSVSFGADVVAARTLRAYARIDPYFERFADAEETALAVPAPAR